MQQSERQQASLSETDKLTHTHFFFYYSVTSEHTQRAGS